VYQDIATMVYGCAPAEQRHRRALQRGRGTLLQGGHPRGDATAAQNSHLAKLSFVLAAGLAFTGWPTGSARAAKDAAECPIKTDDEALRAALQTYINIGNSDRRRADKDLACLSGAERCVTWTEYKTPDELMASNPGCCSVLKRIPGDLPVTYRPNLAGLADPKMFAVEVRFRALGKSQSLTLPDHQPYTYSGVVVIDCYGNRQRGDVP
jgi:hypothetical protein